LRADESQAEMRLAQLEIVFFRVLEDSERPPKIIFAALATQPALFAQMVAWIYREESGSEQESAADENSGEGAIRRAEACGGILAAWDGVPGEGASSPADRERVLLAWANEALGLTSAQRRTESGLSAVADVLARAPAGADGAWPAVAARQLLESGTYPDLAVASGGAGTPTRRRGVVLDGEDGGLFVAVGATAPSVEPAGAAFTPLMEP
jgi:hypothetical protein